MTDATWKKRKWVRDSASIPLLSAKFENSLLRLVAFGCTADRRRGCCWGTRYIPLHLFITCTSSHWVCLFVCLYFIPSVYHLYLASRSFSLYCNSNGFGWSRHSRSSKDPWKGSSYPIYSSRLLYSPSWFRRALTVPTICSNCKEHCTSFFPPKQQGPP